METWKTGLFDCTNDKRMCCISFLWPQLQILHQTQIIDQRQCTVSDCLIAHCCLQFSTWVARNQLRVRRYEFNGSNTNDCLASFYCTLCAIHQQTMEIYLRNEKPAGLFMS